METIPKIQTVILPKLEHMLMKCKIFNELLIKKLSTHSNLTVYAITASD